MKVDDVIDGIRAALDPEQLSYLIQRLSASQARDAIAVVGMGCRFPGGCDTPEKLRAFCQDGGNAVEDVPAARWSSAWAPRTLGEPQRGGFLRDIAGFDALFFGIAPVDADYVDPQQRLLLEVSWEALEDAGIVRGRLAGSSTGVFFGMFSNDYFDLQHAGSPYCHAAAATGTQLSMAAGRLSHWLNLTGPSLVVDTACSASLVAIHLACQSLMAGESDLALAGGVQLYLTSRLHVMSSAIGMVSPTAACRVLDAKADGFVHGEGCGILVLKRLADALRDGDRIQAVVRGSAINHDGRTLGLTAPNADAQERVIRRALAQAGLSPGELQYIELHGSGTPLGDPCELDALKRVFAGDAAQTPCALGSVKTNIGHTIAAAGVAGAIRTITAIDSGTLPANPWFETLNPNIDLRETRFVVPTHATPWPSTTAPRTAGVSSFGASGTNAHVILEQAPEPPACAAPRPRYTLLLSAPDTVALEAVRERWLELLRHFSGNVADLCFTAACRRTHHRQRLAVTGADVAELERALSALVIGARSTQEPPRVGLFLSGVPASAEAWAGSDPYCKQVAKYLAHAEQLLRDRAGRSPVSSAEQLVRSVAQQVAEGLAWQGLGIVPAVLGGAGSGVLAVACLDQLITLERLIDAVLELADDRAQASGGTSLCDAVARRLVPEWLATRQVEGGLVFSDEASPTAPAGHAARVLRGCPLWLGDSAKSLLGKAAPAEPQFLASGSAAAMLRSATELHRLGLDLDWQSLLGSGRVLTLPSYPWQRRIHWAVPEDRVLAATQTCTAPASAAVRAPVPTSLSELVARVLGIAPESLGPHSALADLGITSLTATQLREELSRAFAVELSPTALWRHDTVLSLEQTVTRQQRLPSGGAAVPVVEATTLVGIVAEVLGVEPSRVQPETALADLGISSLSAVELRNAVERKLGVSVSATALWRHDTLADLARTLNGGRILSGEPKTSSVVSGGVLDGMNDAEFAALLERELATCAGDAE